MTAALINPIESRRSDGAFAAFSCCLRCCTAVNNEIVIDKNTRSLIRQNLQRSSHRCRDSRGPPAAEDDAAASLTETPNKLRQSFPSIHPSIHPSIYLSICLSVYLWRPRKILFGIGSL